MVIGRFDAFARKEKGFCYTQDNTFFPYPVTAREEYDIFKRLRKPK